MTGDLSGLNGIDSPFTLTSGPSGNAPEAVEGTDYRLTPIIINVARREATFQIFAIEHPGYDPGLRAVLTLESNSDAVQIGSRSEMRLGIRESTPRPLVSFTADTPFQIDSDGYNYLELTEGESREFRIELERLFSRDIRVSVFLSGFTPTVSTPGLAAIPVYQDGIVEHPNRGWRATSYKYQRGQLTIPAGSSGIMFTIDTRAIDNDLYESLESRSLGSIYFRIEGSPAIANPISSRLGLRYIEDDTPTVSFGDSLLGSNRSPEITSREGESFDVWVALDNRIGGNFKVEATLTATVVNGDALRFRIPTVEIASGELGATVTVTVLDDDIINEQRMVALAVERAVLRPTDGSGRSGRALGVSLNRMTVKIKDNEPIRATLSRSSLTLQEGQAETITVDLRGDISALINGEAILDIKARPVEGVERGLIHTQIYRGLQGGYLDSSITDIYLTAERNDYELTPVTINELTGQAMFGVRAVDDSEFDPLESVVFELESRSDDVRVVSANSLKLKIVNNDDRVLVSFTSTLELSPYSEPDYPIWLVPEGEIETYRVVIDRKSNRDTTLNLHTPLENDIFLGENGMKLGNYLYPGYHRDRGYKGPTGVSKVRIPAGELGLSLTVTTSAYGDDVYDFIGEIRLGEVFLYLDENDEHYAYAESKGSRSEFKLAQDKPVPELLFQSSTSDADKNATITAREGESFDVWVAITPQLGMQVKGQEIRLKSELIATTVTRGTPDLEPPDFEIGLGQAGVMVTVRIPDDSLANGQRTVILDFKDAKVVQPTRTKINKIAARVGNSLIVNILDDESPVASLDAPTLTLTEGQTATIKVNLRGDISSLTDSNATLRLEPLPGGTINVASYYELPSTISVNQAGYEASFEVRALEDTNYSGNKSVNFRLVSSSDDIPVEGLDQLTLNIVDNDFPRAEFGTATLVLTEGQTATVQIELSGTIGPLNGNRPTLTLNSRPASVVEYGLLERRSYDEAISGTRVEEVPVPYKVADGSTDYTLTNPLSIDWETRMATFEILAREDGEYDPYENIVFELTSPLAGFVSTQLKLEIVNEDPRPSLSFSSREGFGSVADNPGLLVDEGGQSQFEIVLEHKSNRDVEIGLFLVSSLPDDYDRDIEDLVYTNGGQMPPIPAYAGWGSYIVDHGWANGSEIPEARRLRIPAGELGISLTLDTRLIYEEIFKEIQPGIIGTALFYTDGLAAVASSQNGLDWLLLAFWEERPTLTLAFEDGRSTATVQEGDSFDVRVSLSNSIARRYRIIEAGWTATLVNGPELSWELPTLQTTYDGAGLTTDLPGSERNTAGFTVAGFTVTLTVPEDYSASGDRTVHLGLLDAQVRERVIITPYGSTDLEVENHLTLTVRDDDVPSVSLSRDSLTVPEGRTVTVQVELSGDIESAIGSTLTLVPQLGGSAEPTDYTYNQVTIDEQIVRDARATFVIHAVHDQTSEQLESVTFKLEDPSGATREGAQTELTLNIVDYATPHIYLGSSSLTLPEGQRMEIPIEIGGDLSSLLADTPTLRIEQRAGGTTGYGGYEWALTPITVVDGVARATLELTAATDDDYDPDESYVLELVSSSPDLVPVEPNLLTLRITNDDQLPRVAFKTLNGGPFISVTEGQIAQFKVMLDRRTTQDVELGVFLDDSNTDSYGSFDHNRINELVFLGEELTTPLPIYRGGAARIGYIAGQGLPAGAETPMAQRLIIPAGERSLTLTFDGSKLDDDFSEIFALKIFGYIGLYVFGQAATVWQADSTKPIIYYEDDVPTLALAFDDGSTGVTIDEGAEFDVRLSLSNELKVAHRVEIDWTATLVTGPGLSWQPSNLRPTIDGYGVDVTLTAPDDADNNGDRVFTLGLRNAVLKDPGNAGVAVRLVGTNGLTVTVRDDDDPRVSFATSTLAINEGQVARIPVELAGDIKSLPDTTATLTLRQRAVDTPGYGGYRTISATIIVDRETGQASFEVFAIEDDDYDPGESYLLELVSSLSQLPVVQPRELILEITNNDPLPALSFTSTLPIYHAFESQLRIGEGESGQFQVVADRRSNRDLDFGLFFRPDYKSDMIEGIFSAGPEVTLPIAESFEYLGTPRGWGLRSTGAPIEPNLTIRAGELGVTITFDTAQLDDDIFEPDYLARKDMRRVFAVAFISLDGNSATVLDIESGYGRNSVLGFTRIDDDLPPVSLELPSTRSTVAGESIVVEEGASFDIGVRLDTALLDGFSVRANLTATLIAGPDLSWELPAITIQEYQSGVTLTVTVHDDAIKDDLRTIRLDLRDALLSNYDPDNERGDTPSDYYDYYYDITPYYNLPLSGTNSLTITVLDNDHPRALPGTDYLKIPEGQSVTIQIELDGDIRSALGTTLTLSARPDATATADDYSIGPVVIDEQIVQAARATFEIHTIHDQVREQIENVTFKLESDSGAVQVPETTRLTLDIVDYATPHAALETDLVTLPEGDSVTIQIIFGGDIGSLASNTPTLTLRQLPGGNPGYGGYELTETPITIVDGVAHASLELRADNDADYDPGQSFVLELVSSSDALTPVQPNRLTLEIVNDDSVPSASLRGSNSTGITVISALENSVVQFAINLDRRSIEDLELGVFLDDQGSSYDPLNGSANLDELVFANPEDPTALPLYTGGGDYIDEQGWSQGTMIPEARLLTIPAGSTTLTFTFDATRLDDDLFKSLALKFLGYIRLYVDGVGVTTRQPNSLAAISSIEDDIPTLDLTFDDGNLTSAVREGDQFDIRVNLSNRIENELYEIIAGLTTTLVTGPDFSWQPPDLQIGTGVSGLTLTLTAPNDDLLSGDRTLLLGLEDVVLGDSVLGGLVGYSPRKVTLSASNGLTLTVYDDDFPRASFSTSMLTLEEGRATTIPIQLDRDLRSLADVTTTLMLIQQPGTTATADDYTPNPPIITIAPGESVATMPISAVDDELYDPGEIVTFKLRSLTDGVFVDPDSVLTLNIVENDPSARLSISALNLREGESAMIAVQLDGDLDLITDDGALQLERQSGTATVEDDYELIAGTIDRATRQALFEIRAAEDTSYDPGEIVTFRLVTSPAEEIELLGSTELILNIVDDFIYASVTTPEVNLEEGHSATVEIQLEGDLTLLLEEQIALTVTPRPGQTAEGEDYELTPITVDEATSRATVEVLALNDDHYDPAETALLEFGPDTARDNIRWVGSNLVTLNIADNGEEPFISFKGVSAEIQTDEPDPYLTVLEGETAHFRAELSRPAEYDIRFMPILSVANEMVTVEGLDAIFNYANASRGYREGEGWSSGSDISEPHSVTIPAGELGVDFSVNTAELDNDSFGFLGTKEITSIYLNVKGSAVRTDRDSSTLTLKYSEDDIPVLSFVDQNFVVTEGDSVDISIASGFPLPDGFEIEVTLTTITDATALDLELPTVTIGPSSSSNPVTTFSLETPDDSISNRPGDVIVQMTDAVLKETVWPYRQLPLGVMEELGLDVFGLTILDNDPATVSLRRAAEYLLEPEGDNLMIGLSFRGDVSSLAGSNDILTIEQQSGDAVEGDDYTLTPIVIKDSGLYNSFEIYITDDRYYEPQETAAFVLKSTSPDITVVDLKRFWLTIPANDFLRASLSPSELTLMEGESATVTAQLDGDLSPLIDGRATLALELLSDATLSNDYTLTPITIDTATSVASFEIFATDDSDYDPGEQIRLGLTSPWDRGYISPPRWLTLNIQDNDEQPLASFTSESDFPTDDDGIPYLQVTEGEQAQFKLALNHKTNYDLRFSVFLDSRLDNSRININDLVSTAQLDPIPVDDDHQQQYSEGQGWSPGPSYDIPESDWLTIPAGESGIDFTFDTAQLDDDLYDFFEQEDIGTIYLALQEAGATIVTETSRLALRYTQDEQLPELSFESSDSGTPRDLHIQSVNPVITVDEGDSFSFSIASSVQIGSDFRIKVGLTTTVSSGAPRELELPAVEITPDGRRIVLTLQVPDDDLANGDSIVHLTLTDATLEEDVAGTTREHQLDVSDANEFVLTIRDDDFAHAWLGGTPSTDDPDQIPLTLREGRSSWISVDLAGARIDSLPSDTLLTLEPQSDQNSADYTILESEITLTDARANARFRIRADNDNIYELTETVVFKLRSSSPDLLIIDPSEIVLTIEDTDLLPEISFVRNNPTLGVTEGQSTTIDVAINRASNFAITVRTRIAPGDPEMSRINGYYPEDFDQLISPNPIVIPPGETRATIVLDTAPIDNSVYNRFERFNSTGYNIGQLRFEIDDIAAMGVDEIEGTRAFRNIFVREDDELPTLSLTRSRTDLSQAITVNEGEQFEIWAGLSHLFAETTLMDLTLRPLGGSIMASGTVDIAPGSYGEAITLTAVDDELYTGDRVVELSLNGRIMVTDRFGGGQIRFRNINSFVVTIIDNDEPPHHPHRN